MLSPVVTATEFITGERMTAEEFLRRWEELPDLKNAELIDGIVHVPSPVGCQHGGLSSRIIWWIAYYKQATSGCEAGSRATWLMLGSVPQPDVYLRISPSHGGQSWNNGLYGGGAPELIAEVCDTSTEVDFGPKRKLYQRAGVREYITIETFGKRIVWRMLENGVYVSQEVPPDGILRSQVFPGLWLDVAAFWVEDGAKMLAALNAGLASEDHQKFVVRLAAAK
jgi:Uma2 family endonuclease